MDLDGRGSGEELGEVDGGENVIRRYCMKKKSFSIKEPIKVKLIKVC